MGYFTEFFKRELSLNNLPTASTGEPSQIFILLFFTAIIILYSVFIYYFYQFLARKNIITLNLNQYNKYKNPALVKSFAVILYIIEYIIILPFITFFWFSILSILVFLLAEGIETSVILLISASLVAAVRVSSYVSETLSKDLAKMVPFTLLAIAITRPGFFSISSLIERMSEIPNLFSNVPYYLIFIVMIELTARVIDFVRNFNYQEGELEPESE